MKVFCTRTWDEVLLELVESPSIIRSNLLSNEMLLFWGEIIRAVEVVNSRELARLASQKPSANIHDSVIMIKSELHAQFVCMVVECTDVSEWLISNDCMYMCGETIIEKIVNFFDGQTEKSTDDLICKTVQAQIPSMLLGELEKILVDEAEELSEQLQHGQKETMLCGLATLYTLSQTLCRAIPTT